MQEINVCWTTSSYIRNDICRFYNLHVLLPFKNMNKLKMTAVLTRQKENKTKPDWLLWLVSPYSDYWEYNRTVNGNNNWSFCSLVFSAFPTVSQRRCRSCWVFYMLSHFQHIRSSCDLAAHSKSSFAFPLSFKSGLHVGLSLSLSF